MTLERKYVFDKEDGQLITTLGDRPETLVATVDLPAGYDDRDRDMAARDLAAIARVAAGARACGTGRPLQRTSPVKRGRKPKLTPALQREAQRVALWLMAAHAVHSQAKRDLEAFARKHGVCENTVEWFGKTEAQIARRRQLAQERKIEKALSSKVVP
jgi:hypothetical protein